MEQALIIYMTELVWHVTVKFLKTLHGTIIKYRKKKISHSHAILKSGTPETKFQ
jgi:hypothetical protein